MAKQEQQPLSPSQFYRSRRPEYFSDSIPIESNILPKELLAFELEKISTNQKENDFETFCRRLAEKTICPNLIPQVGPTGGGDGKTDTETYPISANISERWFIPENGWDRDEKWAFAISAKADWKSKCKGDIKKIVDTARGYTRIYFMSNQLISSKKKKDCQDELKTIYGIDIVILDAVWILEKIYTNHLQDLAVDALSLSSVYKSKGVQQGPNDTVRHALLTEMEEKIASPGRYFEYDHQLVEDALEAAILSRMLEKPREEVEGKFERAIRFGIKLNDPILLERLYYQRAWTAVNWYDDYAAFANAFKHFKGQIDSNSSIAQLEHFQNLFNILSSTYDLFDFKSSGIDLQTEENQLDNLLTQLEKDNSKPVSAIMAKTKRAIHSLFKARKQNESPDQYIKTLKDCIVSCDGMLDYPFETYQKSIEVLGNGLANNPEYDLLVDALAIVSEKRSSELSAGRVFFKRAQQKKEGGLYKDGIIFFGKAVMKVAKEESREHLYASLIGLSICYEKMGLFWAAHSCDIAACAISFHSWYNSHTMDVRAYPSVARLAQSELLLGRVPSFLNWYELLGVLSGMVDLSEYEEPGEPTELVMDDVFLCCRLLNSDSHLVPEDLPDILEIHKLMMAGDVARFMLGHTEEIIKDMEAIIKDKADLDEYYRKMADQPFRHQMRKATDYLVGDTHMISSKILGCEIEIRFPTNKDLFIFAEMLLAFLEAFMATWLSGAYPTREKILVYMTEGTGEKIISATQRPNTSGYDVLINTTEFEKGNHAIQWEAIINFISMLLHQNFQFDKTLVKIESLFRDEEIDQRMSLIFEHRKFTTKILGNDPKVFYKDFTNGKTLKNYPSKRTEKVLFNYQAVTENTNENPIVKPDGPPDDTTIGHHKRRVSSIINDQLWDAAHWKGFGFGDARGEPPLIFIAYENSEAGKKIFEQWIEQFGTEDKGERIHLTIIRGINSDSPHWYRVVIYSNQEKDQMKESELVIVSARMHTMNPDSPANLEILIKLFEQYKEYILVPAEINIVTNQIRPFVNLGIRKRSLHIRHAWEIGPHDLDMIGVLSDDKPVMPDGVTDAPVIKTLERKRSLEKPD